MWTHSKADDSELARTLWEQSENKLKNNLDNKLDNLDVLEKMKLHVHSDIELRLLNSGIELRTLAGVIRRKIGS